MAEGLSASEVGKEISEHRHRALEQEEGQPEASETSDKKSHRLTILEAVLLAVVAVLAAWSGFASAKWGTESSLALARASAARTEASHADLLSMETRNFDSSTFETWFIAYIAHNRQGMVVAERRFRPQFDVAFRAWLQTDPFHNPKAPKGPTYMPQYTTPGAGASAALEAKASAEYAVGDVAASNSDNYVRITVFLATVLFLVGISGHFQLRSARLGLIGVACAMLLLSVIELATSPIPHL